MSKRIFITATNTDIGKTYTTILLLQELASRGLRVGVIKPIETGVVNGYYPDGEELLSCIKELNPECKDLELKDIVPISHKLPAAPFVANDAKALDIQKIDTCVAKLENLCDVLLFEGAGGLFVPLDKEYMIIDLIEVYQCDALLVTHCSLGCINDTLLSKKALDDAKIKNTVAFNCRTNDESFKEISKPYFDAINFKVMRVDEDIDKICDVVYNF